MDLSQTFAASYRAFLQNEPVESLKLPHFIEGLAGLFKFFNCAQQWGGFYGVDQGKKWKEVARSMGMPLTTSCSSNAKSAYDRLLRPFEEWLQEHAWEGPAEAQALASAIQLAPNPGAKASGGGGGRRATRGVGRSASLTPSPGAQQGRASPPLQPASREGGGPGRKRKSVELAGSPNAAPTGPSAPTLPAWQQQAQPQAVKVGGAAQGQLAMELAAAAAAAAAAPCGGEQAAGAQGDTSSAAEEVLVASILPSVGPLLQVPEALLEEQGERVVGALRSGLPSQESWALNALALLSFQAPLLLSSLAGLAEALVQLVRRGFLRHDEAAASSASGSGAALPPRPTWLSRELAAQHAPQPALQSAASAGAALVQQDALRRWQHLLPDHPQLEHRAQAGAAAAQVLYNAAAAAPEVNALVLLSPACLQCYVRLLQAAKGMYSSPASPGSSSGAVLGVRWRCEQPFLQEAAVSVLQLLERLASHMQLEPPAAGASEGGEAQSEGGALPELLEAVVALVAPGRPLLPLLLCTAALDTLTAWAASGAGNAIAVQSCCTADSPQLLRNVADLLACPFDEIRAQGEERVVEEGGFPQLAELVGEAQSEEGGAGLREVCIDMATVITQVRLLASATQLLLRVVSSRAVEVRRSVALHIRLIRLLAGVAAHDHPGYPLSWQINPTRAAHLTAIKDRMLPLFEHRSIVLKQARMHATTILASLAFDPATRQYVLPYEAQILQQVMCGRVPSDGPMNALLAALTSNPSPAP